MRGRNVEVDTLMTNVSEKTVEDGRPGDRIQNSEVKRQKAEIVDGVR
jgi:hypothetical protein